MLEHLIQTWPVLGSQRQHPQNEVLGIWRRAREGATIKSPPTWAMAGGSIVDNQGCYGCHKVNKQVGGDRVGMSNMGEVCRRSPQYVVKVAVYFVAVMYFVVVGTRVCTPGIHAYRGT